MQGQKGLSEDLDLVTGWKIELCGCMDAWMYAEERMGHGS
jgi:hypothetical protein